ncbi:MAG: FeoA family protein [Candidatus Thorarchaeota archaeon]
MDEKGTHVDSKNRIQLTSVRPGTTCILVGVSNIGGRRLGRKRHRKRFGGFFKHKEHRESERYHRGQRQIIKRLLDLGLTKGCTFKVVQGSGRGPVLVEVRGTRIALGHGLASKIIVETVEEQA